VKRPLPALFLLSLLSCNQHVAELEALDVALDQQLAEKMAIANNLGEFRRASERLEAELKEAAAELDGGVPAVPATVADETPIVGPTPLPPVSTFESESTKTLRRRIEEKRRRIAELDKVIGEAKSINRRNSELYRQLELLNELRRGRKQTPPAP
jgi:DNA repair exonuclease SbcCD ATPase subunit